MCCVFLSLEIIKVQIATGAKEFERCTKSKLLEYSGPKTAEINCKYILLFCVIVRANAVVHRFS